MLHFLCAKIVGAIIMIGELLSHTLRIDVQLSIFLYLPVYLPPSFDRSIFLSPSFPFSSYPLFGSTSRCLRNADYVVLIDAREWLMKYSMEHQLSTQKMYTRHRTILPDSVLFSFRDCRLSILFGIVRTS